jgi:hypothetical protein
MLNEAREKAYAELWEMPEDIATLFRRFTSEVLPIGETRDPRRTFANEFLPAEQNLLLRFLQDHHKLIVSDVLKGRGKFSAEWFLVILYCNETEEWALKSINYVLNVFGNGDISATPPATTAPSASTPPAEHFHRPVFKAAPQSSLLYVNVALTMDGTVMSPP